MEDLGRDLRGGMLEVLCWACLRYFGATHATRIVQALKIWEIEVSVQVVGQCLRRLEGFGLVESSLAEEDGRLRLYCLTKMGEYGLTERFEEIQQCLGAAAWLMNRKEPPFS